MAQLLAIEDLLQVVALGVKKYQLTVCYLKLVVSMSFLAKKIELMLYCCEHIIVVCQLMDLELVSIHRIQLHVSGMMALKTSVIETHLVDRIVVLAHNVVLERHNFVEVEV